MRAELSTHASMRRVLASSVCMCMHFYSGKVWFKCICETCQSYVTKVILLLGNQNTGSTYQSGLCQGNLRGSLSVLRACCPSVLILGEFEQTSADMVSGLRATPFTWLMAAIFPKRSISAGRADKMGFQAAFVFICTSKVFCEMSGNGIIFFSLIEWAF